MAVQRSNPDNKNYLSPIGFKFTLQRLPHVAYFATKASIPEITLGQIDTIDNTFIKLPVPGDKLSFGLVDISFKIDEDMRNFREIYDWMIALGYPDNFQQRADLINKKTQAVQPQGEVYSDGSLIITTNSYVPNIELKFVDMYPVVLSAPTFDIEGTGIETMEASVSFAYRKYVLTDI